jgi:putative tricarboxylic transport membrane protein
LVALAGLVMLGARDIPPPIYDPLGSAAMPVIVAGLIAILAVVDAGQRILAARHARAENAREEQLPERLRLAAAFSVLAVAYVAAMSTGMLGFEGATALFAVGSMLLLARFRRSAILPAIVIAAMIAFGGYWFFTQLFFVALP